MEAYRREIDFRDQRYIRKQEVELSGFDSAQVLRQNADLLTNREFKTLKDLLGFVSGLRVRISEENLMKCIKGFIGFSDQVEPGILEDFQFMEFLEIIQSNINLISQDKNLLILVQFSDLYCITNEEYWETLERKVFSRVDQMDLKESVIPIMQGFSNQNEGSDHFYDSLEGIFLSHLNELDFSDKVNISQAYFKVKKGTIDFFLQINDKVIKEIETCASFEQIGTLSHIFKKMKNKNLESFNLMKKRLFHLLQSQEGPKLGWRSACQIAEGFGFEYGDKEFFKVLETEIFREIGEIDPQVHLEPIINGFIRTFHGSEELFEKLKPIIIENLALFNIKQTTQIVSSFHIAEYDDRRFFHQIERYVVQRLKDVQAITVAEIYDIVKCYTVTRVGSREIYKLLEIVIKFRFEDIKKDHEVLKGLYVYYTKSGLVSPELLRDLELLM